MRLMYVFIPIIFLLPSIVVFLFGMAIRQPETATQDNGGASSGADAESDGDGSDGTDADESVDEFEHSAHVSDDAESDEDYDSGNADDDYNVIDDENGNGDNSGDANSNDSDGSGEERDANAELHELIKEFLGDETKFNPNKKSDQLISIAVFLFVAGLIISAALIVGVKATPLTNWWPDWFFS